MMESRKNEKMNGSNIFPGVGKMADLIHSFDWSNTTVGPLLNWPQSLRTALSIVLNSPIEMMLFWGPDLICFYNDSFSTQIGKKNLSEVTGIGCKKISPALYYSLKPQIGKVFTGNLGSLPDSQLFPFLNEEAINHRQYTYHFSPVYNETSTIGGILLVCNRKSDQDIIGKVNTIANARFQNLVSQATVGIIVLSGEEMRVEIVNDMYGQLINCTPQELIGKPLFTIIPDAEKVFRPILNRVRLSGDPIYLFDQPYTVVVNNVKKEGFLNIVYQPYRETDGTISGVTVLCHDMTEQVSSRKKLEEEKERTRLALEAGDLGVFEVDVKTDSIITDKRLDEIFGFEKKASRQELFSTLLDEDKIVRNDVIRDSVSTGIIQYKARILRPDKTIRWIMVHGKTTYNENHEPERLYGIIADITEEQLYQERLETLSKKLYATNDELTAANEELAASNEEILASNEEFSEINKKLSMVNSDLDNFIYCASHDLKAPINNLEGLFNSILDQIELKPDLKDIKLMTDQSFNRFKKTVEHLTQITKLERDQELEITRLNIEQVIKDATLDIQNIILQSKVKITLKLEVPEIRFAEKNLRSIVYNLISNAIKYSSNKRIPEINISSYFKDEYVVIEVEDNGIGMTKENLKVIFGMFKRVHDHVEGSGIGLFIVKKIIDNAGGRIEVESEVGRGSRFMVYLRS